MAVTREQTASFASGTTSGTRVSTFSTNPPAGSKVLVGIVQYSQSAPTSVTDNASNSYTLDRTGSGNTVDANLVTRIYRADSIALPGAGALVVTVNGAASFSSAIAVAYSGVASGAPSATNQNLQTSGTTGSSGAAGGAATGLQFGTVVTTLSANPANIATTSPATQLGAEQDGANRLAGAVSDRLNSGASAAIGWSWPVSTTSTGAIVAYDAVVATTASASTANGTGDAPDPGTSTAQAAANASATGDVPDPTISTSMAVVAGTGQATGDAPDPVALWNERITAGVAQAAGQTFPTGTSAAQGAWSALSIGLALAPSITIPTATVFPDVALGWCTANGGTTDTQDGESGSTNTATPNTAQGQGTVPAARTSAIVRPAGAGGQGSAHTPVPNSLSTRRRVHAGVPVAMTSGRAGTPVRIKRPA